MIEGGLYQSLQVMDSSGILYLPSLLLDFWCLGRVRRFQFLIIMVTPGTSSLLKSDGTDELPEESLVNCLQDVEACFPEEEMYACHSNIDKPWVNL
jgi:hypothetical protein